MWIVDRFGMLVAISGLIICIVGLAATHTIKIHEHYHTYVYELGVILVFLHVLVLVKLPNIRNDLIIKKEKGVEVQGLIFLVTLLLSGLPSALEGVDESWFILLFGLPMWAFGIEMSLQAGTSPNIFGLCMGVTVSIACSQLSKDNVLIWWGARYFAFVQPVIYTALYYLFMPVGYNPHLAVSLLLGGDGNLDEGRHILVLDPLADDVAEDLLKQGAQNLLQIDQLGRGKGGGNRLYTLDSIYAVISPNLDSYELRKVELSFVNRLKENLKKWRSKRTDEESHARGPLDMQASSLPHSASASELRHRSVQQASRASLDIDLMRS